jgi:hypothetical protein
MKLGTFWKNVIGGFYLANRTSDLPPRTGAVGVQAVGGVLKFVQPDGTVVTVGGGGGGGGGYREIEIPGAAMIPQVTGGASIGSEETASGGYANREYMVASGSAQTKWQYVWHPPGEYDSTAGVKLRMVWKGSAGASADDTVILGVAAAYIRNDDDDNPTLGTRVTVTDTLLAVNDRHVSPTLTPTPSGTYALNAAMAFTFDRAGDTDTMDEFMKLMTVLVQYKELETAVEVWS